VHCYTTGSYYSFGDVLLFWARPRCCIAAMPLRSLLFVPDHGEWLCWFRTGVSDAVCVPLLAAAHRQHAKHCICDTYCVFDALCASLMFPCCLGCSMYIKWYCTTALACGGAACADAQAAAQDGDVGMLSTSVAA
jgi:hypothetical protein